jgi:signal transduction histidine kinase
VAVLAAMDRMEEVARRDSADQLAEQLGGAGALALLIEVAHDMRSPIGSMLFLLDRVRESAAGALAPAELAQLGLVHGAAAGLGAIIGDLMELARGGDRLAAGAPAPFSLRAVAEAVETLARPLAEEKALQLVDLGMPSEARLGHAPAVQRVLLNLVTNALKYTPEGRVAFGAEALDGTRVRFIVRDTGPGIPPSVMNDLFRVFRPRARTGDHAFSSAGLGLAICARLLGAMGSQLEVDTSPERGTCFHFVLDLPPAPVL